MLKNKRHGRGVFPFRVSKLLKDFCGLFQPDSPTKNDFPAMSMIKPVKNTKKLAVMNEEVKGEIMVEKEKYWEVDITALLQK